MNRAAKGALALFGVIAVTAGLVWFDPSPFHSTTDALVGSLEHELLTVAVPVTLVTEGALIYTALRFRNNDDPKPTRENRKLEIAWTVATAVVLLFVGVASYQVLAHPAVTTTPQAANDQPADAVDVTVVGRQWFWTFRYPDANVTAQTLVLPTNRPVYLTVTSKDVIHSVHVPALGLKQDAIPGQNNTIRTTVTAPGTYQLYCAEYCGSGHSHMTATVRVVSQSEYQQWLQKQKQSSGGSSSGSGGSGGATNTTASSKQSNTTGASNTTVSS